MQNEHEIIMENIFKLITKKNELDINLLNNAKKTPLQIALENNNYAFIKEILKLNQNPNLLFMDENNNSIFHFLSSLIFESKIAIYKRINLVNLILDKIKNILSEEELNKINNLYNDNGFTPLLKLMYEYYKNIDKLFEEIRNEEECLLKKEKIEIDESKLKNIKIRPLQEKVNNYKLDETSMKIVHIKATQRFNIFIKEIFSIIKKYISFKMTPFNIVKKLSIHREEKQEKSNDKKYFENQGKNNILSYLMKYPSKLIFDYFIKDLKVPINEINLENRNCLFFLFENINIISYIEGNHSLSIKILNELINYGINLE